MNARSTGNMGLFHVRQGSSFGIVPCRFRMELLDMVFLSGLIDTLKLCVIRDMETHMSEMISYRRDEAYDRMTSATPRPSLSRPFVGSLGPSSHSTMTVMNEGTHGSFHHVFASARHSQDTWHSEKARVDQPC